MEQKRVCILITEDSQDCGGPKGVAKWMENRLGAYSDDHNVIYTSYHVVEDVFPENVDNYDAYLVTGSHYSVNATESWIGKLETFIREIESSPKKPKLFGICFGHQITAKALGGKVGINDSQRIIWGLGKVQIDLELASKSFFKEAFGDHTEEILIAQSHYDQIKVLPPDSKVLGKSTLCPYEIIMHGDNIITLQGHPEISKDKMLQRLTHLQSNNVLTSEEEKEAVEFLEMMTPCQENTLMQMIVSFLLCK